MHIVQHGIDGGHRRDADRPRRKSAVLVGVVRAVHRKPLLINTVSREILCGELYRRVGLQRHADVQAVDVHACYLRHFSHVVGLFVHDARQRDDLRLRKAGSLCLLFPFKSPELPVLFAHLVEELVGRCVPVEVIGIRDEHCRNRLRRESVFPAGFPGGQPGKKLGTAEHHLLTDICGKVVERPHGPDGYLDGCLKPVDDVAGGLERPR